MTTSYIVTDKKESHLHHTCHHECVSLNEFNKSPILSIKTPLVSQLDFGSIIDEKFHQQYKYFEHKYELARIIGKDEENKKLLVYGAKIGKHTVDIKNFLYQNYTFYKRGDLLLLKQSEDNSNKFFVVHNIDILKIEAERDNFGKNAR